MSATAILREEFHWNSVDRMLTRIKKKFYLPLLSIFWRFLERVPYYHFTVVFSANTSK
jgi:hypothetical protein